MAGDSEKRVAKREMAEPDELGAPYLAIFGDVSKIIDAARESAARSVNAAITAAYWLIGHRIVEFEQSGGERAEYGAALVERLAEDLTGRFGRGFSRQNIQNMRLFYLSYPPAQIRQTPSGNLPPPLDSGFARRRLAFPKPPPSKWASMTWLPPFRCSGPPTCDCCRSGARAPAISMKPRGCEADGRSASLTGRSIPSSTSAPPSRRTKPQC